MHEFETFVYLDVQKTGSTFVSYMLQQYTSEKELAFRKHGRVGGNYNPEKFYFISARDPLDQYISLYSHGCSAMGGLSNRLRNRGHEDLYDSTWSGFRRWLKLALDPENAALFDPEYGKKKYELSKLIGFQTYRFLELALQNPLVTLYACKTQDDIREAYKTKNIAKFIIRHEHFNEDVEELLTTKIRKSVPDLDAALKFLKEGRKLNISDRVDQFLEDPNLGPKNRRALKEREWFLHELLGY